MPNGAIKCMSCDETTGIHKLLRDAGMDADVGPSYRHKSRELDDDDAASYADLTAVYRLLRQFQTPDVTAPVRRWLSDERGWPDEAVARAMTNPDMFAMPPSSRIVGNDDARQIVKLFKGRALLAMRGAEGAYISGRGRALKNNAARKSRELDGVIAGAPPGVRCFGSIPVAVHAERVVIVEGGPDWLAVYGATDDTTAVIGVSTMTAFRATAEALATAIGVHENTPEVILWPDASHKARDKAREATGPLQRAGATVRWVQRDGDPKVEDWEASDVLKAYGVEGLRKALDDARVERGRATDMSAQRRQLTTAMQRIFVDGGRAVTNAPTGVGKSYITMSEAIRALADGKCKRVLFAVPTRDLALEKEAEARHLVDHIAPGAVAVGSRLGRSADDCRLEYETPGVVAAAAALRPGGAAALCFNDCPFSSECTWHRRARRALPHGLTITTHAAISPRRDEHGVWSHPEWAEGVEVVIHDEDSFASLKQPLSLDQGQLATLIDGGALARLTTIDKASSSELAEVMESVTIVGRTCDDDQEQRDIRALTQCDDTTLQRLRGRAPWYANDALTEASERGWRGCTWYRGQLTIPTTTADVRLLEGTYATLYLDATATEASAAIVLPGAQWVDLGSTVPHSTRVIALDRFVSKSCQTRTAEGAALAKAVRERFDGDNTLHVTHKPLVEDVRAAVTGKVIHHGGAEARGSNAYRADDACDTITLDAWHVPTVARRAEAEWLQDRAAVVAPSLNIDADEEAQHRLEVAPVLQAIGRIGPNGGDFKQVVLMGPAPATLPVDEVLRAAELTHVRGPDGAAAALRKIVDDAGGLWSPSAHKARIDGALTRLSGSSSIEIRRTTTQPCQTPAATASALIASVQNHFAQSWSAAAAAAGLDIAKIPNSAGAPIVLIVKPGARLSPSGVRRALSPLALDWVRLGGRRVDLVDKLKAAMDGLPDGVAVTLESLAEVATTTTRTVRRWIQAAGWPSADAFLSAYRVEVGLDDIDDIDDVLDTLTIVEDEDDAEAVAALCSDSFRRSWYALHGPDVHPTPLDEAKDAAMAEVVDLASARRRRRPVERDPDASPPGSHQDSFVYHGSAVLVVPRRLEPNVAPTAAPMACATAAIAEALPNPAPLVVEADVIRCVEVSDPSASVVHDRARPRPEDYDMWPLIASAGAGDTIALDEVLRLYLPMRLMSDVPRWVDMLSRLDDEHRALYVENLWLHGAVDEVYL